MKSKPGILLIWIPLILLLLFVTMDIVGSVDSGIDEEQLDDAPYLFWKNDSVVCIGAISQGELHVQIDTVRDSLSFVSPADNSPDTLTVVSAPFVIKPSSYENVERIFSVSDVEGEYENLVTLLQANGVIDQHNHWSWGTGHLVFVGDMVDRGDKVTETLWLIHQLEREAALEGGCVHPLLGNHETMILAGDLRYIHDKYKLVARKHGISYRDLFAEDSEFGRWLRSKNTILKINDLLFVHGGISPSLLELELGLDEINSLIRSAIDKRWTRRYDDNIGLLYGGQGPIWYRGYFDDPKATTDEVQEILDFYNAQSIVVGHTVVDSIQKLYEGRVTAIDVTLTDPTLTQALLCEDGVMFRTDIAGNRTVLQ